MMEKYYELFQYVLIIFGFFPSVVIEALYELYIVPIIIDVVIIYIIKKDNSLIKLLSGAGIIVFSFLSYLCSLSNPGMGDSFGTLSGVVNAVASASFFAILTIICLIIFTITLCKKKKNSVILENNNSSFSNTENQSVVGNMKNYCTVCGSKVEGNNRFCTNCGKEL